MPNAKTCSSMYMCSAHAEVDGQCWQRSNRYYSLYCDSIDVVIEWWMLPQWEELFFMCHRQAFCLWTFVTCLFENVHWVSQKLQTSSSWWWCSPGHFLTLGWYLSSVYIRSSSSSALFLIRMCLSVSGPSVLRLRWSSLSVPFFSGDVFSVRVCF